MKPATIFTIGHSTRTEAEFLELLRAHGIRRLVDVRRFPGSRRYPQFSRASLARTLSEHGIEYLHVPELGGRRMAQPSSVNTAWRSASFRGYADYMQTPEFERALATLEVGAAEKTAIMCAEAVYWRCHRQLIADALVGRGHEVRHILSTERAEPHHLNPHARLTADGTVTYPGEDDDLQASLL